MTGPDFGHPWCYSIPGQGMPNKPSPPRPKPYSGPFDPPPAESMEGAIGWRHIKITVPGENRWTPIGWEIIFPDHIIEVDMNTGLATRDSAIHAP
jgi:hypothetical protein